MPLGNPRDFGHQQDTPLIQDPENAWTDAEPQNQGVLRDINNELAGNLGPDAEGSVSLEEMAINDPFEGAEVGEYLGDGQTVEGSPEELAALMDYLSMMKPEYAITPMDLVVLKNEGIITVDEARDYLAARGVIAG